jgi:CDP-diacylglycerol--glycerol-3-phosphate 3-phosphatidyltransferase
VNLPNTLTISRIFLVPVLIAVLFSTAIPDRELYAVGIFLAAAFTDLFDGYIARRRRQITKLGILLDPIADKLLISAAFISLVQMDPQMVPAWMAVVIIGREFAVTGLRSVAATHGIIIAASELGKAKMVLQVIAVTVVIVAHRYGHISLFGLTADVRFWAKVSLWLVVVLALISAATYFQKFWRAAQIEVPQPPSVANEPRDTVAAGDVAGLR